MPTGVVADRRLVRGDIGVDIIGVDGVVNIIEFDCDDDYSTVTDEPSNVAETTSPQSEQESDALALAAFGPARHMRSTLAGVASVVAPGSLVTALLYYFGWARASAEADALGLQDSLLGFSTQDYLLSSISPMFWPLVVALAVTLAGLLGHGTIVAWADHPDRAGLRTAERARVRRAIRWLCGGLIVAAVVLFAFGAYGFDKTTRFFALASPLSVTVGIALLGYAVHLYHRFLQSDHGPVNQELRAMGLLSSSILTVLLLLSLFWSVSHYAAVTGIDLGIRLEQHLADQPNVTVYSAARLHLQPPVTETQLFGDPSAYHFMYTGLKLLFRSDHRFFLRPADTNVSVTNIVIAESPDVRLEFSRE